MKNWKRLLSLLLALAMVLSLCACNNSADQESDDAEGSTVPNATNTEPSDPSNGVEPSIDPDASASPAIEADLTQDLLTFVCGMSADDELLTIDGIGIPADLALYWLFMDCDNFASYYGMLGFNMADFADALLEDAIAMCTYYTMLRQKASELGCLPTDAQIQNAQDQMMANGEEFYEMLKTAYGLTDESMEYIYTMSAYYQNLLDAMVPSATDEMLNNYIYQAKHILLLTVDMEGQPVQQEDGSYAYPSLDEETIAKKKQQAEDILAQLQAADDLEAKFDELMNQFSEDSGLESNPDGYVTTAGEMVPEFEQGALALKPGEISGIVESSYGYHIILRGEVDDIESYAEECREYNLDQQFVSILDGMEAVRTPALEALDLVDFYARYNAYRTAVMEQYQASQDEAAD